MRLKTFLSLYALPRCLCTKRYWGARSESTACGWHKIVDVHCHLAGVAGGGACGATCDGLAAAERPVDVGWYLVGAAAGASSNAACGRPAAGRLVGVEWDGGIGAAEWYLCWCCETAASDGIDMDREEEWWKSLGWVEELRATSVASSIMASGGLASTR